MRRILFGAMPVVFWLAVAPALAQQAISTPILASDENFRDLAGISARYGGTDSPTTQRTMESCALGYSIAPRC